MVASINRGHAAENGYGGEVTFAYEATPWYEVDGPESREIVHRFGEPQQPCGENGDGTAGWEPATEDDEVYCSGGELVVKGRALLEAPDQLVQPGGAYRSYAEFSVNSGGLRVGLSDEDSVELQPAAAPTTDSPFQAFFTLENTAYEAWAVIECADCELDDHIFELLATRYRVTQKTVTDGRPSDPESYTYTYRYDEPATNDAAHSEGAASEHRYFYPMSEFRGHAMVQEVGPGGRVTTTYFYQDDTRKSRANTTLVSDQTFWDGFNTLNTNGWSFTSPGGNQTAERLTGDNALKNNNPDPDWSETAARQAALGDGKLVMGQFRVSGDSGTKARIRVENGELFFGVLVEDSALKFHYNVGGGEQKPGTGIPFQFDRWYVLLLGVDNQKPLIQVWDRDDPSGGFGRKILSYSGSLSLTFKQASNKGTVWLDTYSEGKLYSLEKTLYADQELPPGTLPDIPGSHDPEDLKIYWVYPTQTSWQDFEADAEWSGRLEQYEYNTGEQGGFQYGNRTRAVESSWNGTAWVVYRATKTEYFPTVTGEVYLVGLPGITRSYKCPNGSCGYTPDELLKSTWFLYDGHTSYSTPPNNTPSNSGILTAQRTLVRCINQACNNTANHRYRDEKYTYDGWGNRTIVKAYSVEGTYNTLAGTGEQATTTIYDADYHTCPVEVQSPLYSQWGNKSTLYQYVFTRNKIGCGPSQVTDVNGQVTTASYDEFGRLIKMWKTGDSESEPTVTISYHDWDNPFWTEARQRVTGTTYTTVRKFYDGLGRLIQSQTAGAVLQAGTRDIIVNTWYDADGNVTEQSVPHGKPTGSGYKTPDAGQASTHTDYDILGRPELVTATDGSPTRYVYADLETQVTDAKDHTTTTRFYVWGPPQEVIPPTGPSVSYTYDEADRLLTASRGGATVILEYDKAGRKVTLDDPDMGEWGYTYDALGNLLTQTDARGCITALSYDLLNRLAGKVYSGSCDATPDVAYTYDLYGSGNYGRGRRTGMSDASGSATWKYDTRGRMTEESKVVTGSGTFKTQWTYNSADMPATMKYPSNGAGGVGEQVTFAYHPQGWLNSVVGASTYVQGTVYEAAGRIMQLTRGAGTLLSGYTYYPWVTANGQGRLETITVSSTGVPPIVYQSLGYTYDSVGNVMTIQDDVAGGPQVQTFTYDDADRLDSAQASGGTDGNYGPEDYSYDDQGRLEGMPGLGAYEYSADHVHAVTKLNSVQKYWYDANGNMITRIVGSDTFDLTYDGENRLVQVDKNGSLLMTFKYDGDGRRVQSFWENGSSDVTTAFVGDHFEWSGSTSTMIKYFYAGTQRVAMKKGSTAYFLLGDHLGSTSLVVTASGGLHSEQRYDAWGEKRPGGSSALPTTFRFTGQRQEELLGSISGLYFYGSRWYDPRLGRFIQADSVIPEPGNPQAWDRYAYVLNSPVRYIDPSGHWYYDPGCDCLVHNRENRNQHPEYLLYKRNLNAHPKRDSANPYRVGREWLSGEGPRRHVFVDGDPFTELLKQHAHIQEVRELIAQRLSEGDYKSHQEDYYLGGFQGVPKYAKDYSTLVTFGKTGNLAVTYLGTYELRYFVNSVDVENGEARIQFYVYNESTLASATHPPVLGYMKFWENYITPFVNNLVREGPMSTVTQMFLWAETISFP